MVRDESYLCRCQTFKSFSMKKIFIILFILNLVSCSSSKVATIKTDYKGLKIVEKTEISHSVSINFNELRFYDIYSANDTMKLMYLNFGNWNSLENSSYMSKTQRKVWKNIKLFDTNEKFTIIADGTETKVEYFACLKIIDSKGKDCLKDEHPLKNKVIDFFFDKMKKTRDIYNKMKFKSKRDLNQKLWI